jgi:hypothetical protein
MRPRDLLLTASGLAFGSLSLSWPFGWDTAVHNYVGREWALRGAIPYRDTFDHKPPIIHLIHAAIVSTLGEGMWGIRLFELCCVAALGWACASLAAIRGGREPDGLRGASMLCANILYYGFFNYCNTAQCELLGASLGALALLASVRLRSAATAASVAGLLVGTAFALKPPFLVLATVPAAVLVARTRRESSSRRVAMLARSGLRFVLASALVPTSLVVYFAAHGSAGDLYDLVVRCNLVYLHDEPRLTTLAGVWTDVTFVWRWFCPVASVIFVSAAVATAAAVARRSRADIARWAMAWGLLAAGAVTVAVQLKFYHYHRIVVAPGVLLLVANAMADLSRAVRRPLRGWAPLAFAAAIALAFTRSGGPYESWRDLAVATVRWWGGKSSRAQFAREVGTLEGAPYYADLEAAGLWLREQSAPEDRLLVRGVAVEIYTVSGMRAPGRFFWTAFLTLPSRRFRRDALLAEDFDTIIATKPRWVVTWAPVREGIESTSWFSSLGYVERRRFGAYVVMEYRGSGMLARAGER